MLHKRHDHKDKRLEFGRAKFYAKILATLQHCTRQDLTGRKDRLKSRSAGKRAIDWSLTIQINSMHTYGGCSKSSKLLRKKKDPCGTFLLWQHTITSHTTRKIWISFSSFKRSDSVLPQQKFNLIWHKDRSIGHLVRIKFRLLGILWTW